MLPSSKTPTNSSNEHGLCGYRGITEAPEDELYRATLRLQQTCCSVGRGVECKAAETATPHFAIAALHSMLDFRPKGRTRNYFARGEQRKLLALVFAIGLVLFVIEEAAHPKRWLWL